MASNDVGMAVPYNGSGEGRHGGNDHPIPIKQSALENGEFETRSMVLQQVKKDRF